jgi:photosystem II stability/assembly factor-like uncharacterized protein
LFALLLGFALLQNPSRSANASPTTSDLNSLAILGPNNGWAVGNGGVILHFDGSFWSEIASGTTSDLFGVSFGPPGSESPSAGFAVGGSGGTGTAIYRDQVTWSSITTGLTPPSAQRLAAVFELSPSDAWAVDALSGAFWHWTGSAGLGGGWSLISSAAAGLNSVFMVSPSEGWAVGSGGQIYKYTSGGWTLHSALGTTLNSVFMLNANDGWAVGNGGTIYHYSSGAWTGPVSPGTTSQDLRSVFMLSQTEGWAVGSAGTVLHYSGGTWSALPPNQLATNQDLNSVYFSGGVGFAVGGVGTIIAIGAQPQGVPSAVFNSVYLTSSSDGWIVGCATGGCGAGAGEPVVVHWNGASFTRGIVSGPAGDLYSVFMLNPSEGWAVGGFAGNALILHYSGGSWVQAPSPVVGVSLRAVFMSDSSNGWAVGDNGVILRYSGGSWSSVASPTTKALRGLHMLGASEGWAVGDGGEMLTYQAINGQWMRLAPQTGAQLNSVFVSDSSHGWAAGDGGTILHYDGAIWTSVAILTSTNLNSVVQVNPQEAWAVGDSATILQWTGISWYPVSPSSPLAGSPDLNSIYMVSSNFGLIVGGSAAPGSQGPVLQVPQMVNAIPEAHNIALLMTLTLLVSLLLVSKIPKRRHKKSGLG